MNRQISIEDSINERLKNEPNASKLINTLLDSYYNGTDGATRELWDERRKVKNQLVRLMQNEEKHIVAINRMASAVEDLTNQIVNSRS